MDPMGGIVMTNDGNAILREVGRIVEVKVNDTHLAHHSFTSQAPLPHPAPE